MEKSGELPHFFTGEKVTVYPEQRWYVTLGKGKTVHYVQIQRLDRALVFIRVPGKLGVKPYLKDQVYIVQE